MPRFFVDSVEGDPIEITGNDARHIALSLRMKIGETLILCDGNGREAEGVIASIAPESVVLSVQSRRDSVAEPKTKVILYQALPKLDKMETIVQKAVELGASEIVPVMTSRCISRPDEKTMAKKRERLQKIADEAAKQCGRGKLPPVRELLSFKDAVKAMSTAEVPLLLYEHATAPLKASLEHVGGKTVAVMVGSEGGFSEEEAAFAIQNGVSSVSLGPRILRCETAPLAALSVILFVAGEMEIE